MPLPARSRLGLVAIAVVLAVAAAAVWRFGRQRAPDPIASAGGQEMHLPAPDEGAYFLQGDPRWAGDTVGGSSEPMSAVGCTVCAVAMAADHLGYDVSPKELNARLVRCSGYTERGWLVWDAIGVATEGRICARVPSRLTHSEIDEALRRGAVPVVKFYLPGGVPHWAPIVGKRGTEYLVKDSLDSEKRVAALSDKTPVIVSVRYVERRCGAGDRYEDMDDIAKTREFAKNVLVDGRLEGTRVSLSGTFVVQQLQGVATAAGSQYQFVVRDDLALVATLPEGFVPQAASRYRASGVLRCCGLHRMFPGIEIDDIQED